MATEDDAPDTAPAPARGGKGSHPGHGLLSGPHRDEILIVSTVVLVGLSYLTLRRMSGGGAATAPGLVSASNPGGAVAGFDQATMQGFQQALQDQADHLATLEAAATGGGGVTDSTPGPISHTLFAPSYSGNYVRYGNGLIAEVESDGSILGLNQSEWQAVRKKFGADLNLDVIGGKAGPGGSTVALNLAHQGAAQQQAAKAGT